MNSSRNRPPEIEWSSEEMPSPADAPSLGRQSIRLVDVARSAGVSMATASRALSRSDVVRPETLARVLTAVKELGYVPHGAARALASQRTQTVGAVFPPVDNPIFATATHVLAQTLFDAGYTLLLASHDYDEEAELTAVKRLIERGVDGLVLVGLRHSQALFDLLGNGAIPYELTWSLDRSGQHHSVGVDHHGAALNLTRYLIDLGHRDFAVIAGLLDSNDRALERMNGVREALRDANISLPESRLLQASFSVSSGRTSMSKLLDKPLDFSALICGNDPLAIGAMFECVSRGIRIPEQLSIVGFDDIEMAGQVSPGLTTIHVPSGEIGRQAARRLLARLDGQHVPKTLCLPSQIVARDSSAAYKP